MAARTLDSPNGAVVSLHGRKLYLIGDDTSQVLYLNSTAGGRVVASTRTPYRKVHLGVDASGGAAAVTLTGLKVGDVVVSVTNLTTPGDASAHFEAAITVDGQIQQIDTDLSAAKLLFDIVPAS